MKVEGVFTSGHREASRFGRDVFACDLREHLLENNESRWSKTGGECPQRCVQLSALQCTWSGRKVTRGDGFAKWSFGITQYQSPKC